jgi:hypothetical protein
MERMALPILQAVSGKLFRTERASIPRRGLVEDALPQSMLPLQPVRERFRRVNQFGKMGVLIDQEAVADEAETGLNAVADPGQHFGRRYL